MIGSLPLLTLCSAFAGLASGLHLQFRRQATPPHHTTVKFSSTADPFQFTNVNGHTFDDIYVATIYLDGQSFEVQLDTGSSDLWLDTTGVSTSGFTDTGVQGSIVYGDMTSAQGPILLGNVTFGDFVVPQQAFISAPGSNATTSGDKGLLGVGPPGLSTNLANLAGTNFNGNSVLDNIFSFYPDDPNFITFLLSRSDLGVTEGGSFTIAVIPDNFTAVNDTAALPVLHPDSSEPQWLCQLDNVIVQGLTLNAQGSALLDTGTSLSSAPSAVVDAFYGSISGAVLNGGSYTVPCDSQVDISFILGGVTYPVDPLDAIFASVSSDGTVVCEGAFSYNDPASSGVDFILGDSFLRNVFSLYDFGYWTTVGQMAPFVKLLSVTNITEADANFASLNQARVAQLQAAAQNGTTPDDGPSAAAAPSGSGNTTSSDDGKDTKTTSTLATDSSSGSSVDLSGLTRNSYIIMGLLGVIIVLLVVLMATALPNRNNKGYRAVGTTGANVAPVKYGQYSRTSVDDKYHDS